MLTSFPYRRDVAVSYALQWARGRNPRYADFSKMGGDCTNFISQCLFAGCQVMNHTADTGWYYYDIRRRAPAWTSVSALYRFLTENLSVGPYGHPATLQEMWVGDLLQLGSSPTDFYHTLIITHILRPEPSGIFVCAHTDDAFQRPLSSYAYHTLRPIRIDGYRRYA